MVFPYVAILSEPTLSRGIHTSYWHAHNNVLHSCVVTMAFCQIVILQMPPTCSKRTSSMTQNTILVISIFSVDVVLMFSNSGTCGVPKEPKVWKNTLMKFSEMPNILHHLSKVVRALKWPWSHRNAQISVSGIFPKNYGTCHVMIHLINYYTKSPQRLKNIWWKKGQWWSPISHWTTNPISSAWSYRILHSPRTTWCISLKKLSDLAKCPHKTNYYHFKNLFKLFNKYIIYSLRDKRHDQEFEFAAINVK